MRKFLQAVSISTCLVFFLGGSALAAEIDPLTPFGARATQGAAAGYVADTVCRTCHEAKYASYQAVGMAQSFTRPSKATAMEAFGREYYHAPSDRYYQILERGQDLLFRRYQRDQDGDPINAVEIPVAWVMGSGNRARSYLYQTDWGELYLLPLGWYSETQSWGMAPGFDAPDHEGIHRRIKRECMFCHNAYPEVPAGSDLHWQVQTFPLNLPEGTGCQRCHGPGAEHIKTAASGGQVSAIRSAIVNPARLSAEQRDSVCFQCHMLPAVAVVGARRFGRSVYSFRPGELLSDYLVHIDIEERGLPSGERFEINHHGYRFMQSRCYRESDGALGCTSCHDPHEKPQSAEFRASVAEVCTRCHESRSLLHTAEIDPGSDCVSCHMPRRRTSDVVNVTMTDHRIATGPFDFNALVAPLEEKTLPVTAISLLEFGHPPTGHAAATYRAVAALRAGRSLQAAQRGLEQNLLNHPYPDPTPHLDLMRAQLRLGEFAAAEATARRLLVANRELHVAHTLLGIALLGEGKTREAIAALQRSLALQLDPETHFNLALGYLRIGQNDSAQMQLEAALELRPYMAAAWKYKARLYVLNNEPTEARDALVRSLQLEPLDLTAYDELVDLLRKTGEDREAARYQELRLRMSSLPRNGFRSAAMD